MRSVEMIFSCLTARNRFFLHFIVLLIMVALLGGCGRNIGRMMTASGFGASDPEPQDFVRNARTKDMTYISLDVAKEPKKLTMTPQKAERLKGELEYTGQMAESRGILATREGMKVEQESEK